MNPEFYEIPEGDEHRQEVLDYVLAVSQDIVHGLTPPDLGASQIWQRCSDHYEIPEVREFVGYVSEMEPGQEEHFEAYLSDIRTLAQQVVDGVSESFRAPTQGRS